MADDIILQTQDLVKEFLGFVAVNRVNLKVRRGQIHALIGPNGAGKTTVFNLLTKFLIPTQGTILFNGQDITSKKPAEVAHRGLVRSFQISATFPNLTVLENVRIGLQGATGLSLHFWRSERVLSQLKIVIRTNYSNPPTHGGAVVAAVLGNPELRALWEKELGEMRVRIKAMRQKLVDGLKAAGVKQDMSFITTQIGMFSYSGLNKDQMVRLRSEFGIYGTDTGRMCVAALNSKNIEYVCQAIAKVV